MNPDRIFLATILTALLIVGGCATEVRSIHRGGIDIEQGGAPEVLVVRAWMETFERGGQLQDGHAAQETSARIEIPAARVRWGSAEPYKVGLEGEHGGTVLTIRFIENEGGGGETMVCEAAWVIDPETMWMQTVRVPRPAAYGVSHNVPANSRAETEGRALANLGDD